MPMAQLRAWTGFFFGNICQKFCSGVPADSFKPITVPGNHDPLFVSGFKLHTKL